MILKTLIVLLCSIFAPAFLQSSAFI
jgi:hypothetical protein